MYAIHENMEKILNNLIRNVIKLKNIEKEFVGNNKKRLCCITKRGKN